MRHATIAGARRHIRGWRRDQPDHRDRSFPLRLTIAQVPPAADLTPECPSVRDQGELGSCVANATLEAAGFLWSRAGKPDPELSRLDLYWQTRAAEGTPPAEDSGCQIRDAMKVLARLGACLESTWPYDVGRFAEEPPAPARAEALEHQAQVYYRCPSLRTIKASLAQGFPVVGGFTVFESIWDDAVSSSGDIPYPPPSDGAVGGHAVLFVGYDDDRQILRLQNSWGTGWGRGGRGTLPYRYVRDGLADDFWTLRRVELAP
jgi:C1A family cysteine protease